MDVYIVCVYTYVWIYIYIYVHIYVHMGFSDGSVCKESPCNTGNIGDTGSIPGLVRYPGGGQSNPLQNPCLENPTDRVAWWAPVHRVAKSQTRCRVRELEERFRKRTRPALYRNRSPLMR